jgi:putative alpha-1,2-mannosidase
MQRIFLTVFALAALLISVVAQQKLTDKVNVFLGSSGDHGQMSPAASYPFSMLSICPQTYPTTHTGYEYLAKKYTGFVHTIMEGVGCQGSGGNLLVKPFILDENEELLKTNQTASPGYYAVNFQNGIRASFTVNQRTGVHQYTFPGIKYGLKIDLKHTLSNGFVAEQHETGNNFISGWVESYTTCGAGKYRLYYYIRFNSNVSFTEKPGHQLLVFPQQKSNSIELRIALSSLNETYAKNSLSNASFSAIRKEADLAWETEFSRVKVSGDKEREKLFYSFLYRSMQSPFLVSEEDGNYKASNGNIRTVEPQTL